MHAKPHWRDASRLRKRSREQARASNLPAHLMAKPKTEHIDREIVTINDMEIGHDSIQGYRITMEDAHIIGKLTCCFFCMYFSFFSSFMLVVWFSFAFLSSVLR